MTIIHMETDIVRNLTGQFTQTTEALQSNGQSLISSVQSTDWMGPSRDALVSEVVSILRHLNLQIEKGKILIQRMENEVVEWEQMSGTFGNSGRVLGSSNIGQLPYTGDADTSIKDLRNHIKELEEEFNNLKKPEDLTVMSKGELEKWNLELATEKENALNKIKEVLNGRSYNDLSIDEKKMVDSLSNLATQNEKYIKINSETLDVFSKSEHVSMELSKARLDYSTWENSIKKAGDTISPAVPNPNLRYDRTSNGNCTWYAAEAVKNVSNGRIDISNDPFPNFGNANDWKYKAELYVKNHPDGFISGVDNIPQAGDVAVMPGHVAFVESVEKTPEGNFKVIYSDEGASGTTTKYSGEQLTPQPISINGIQIKRWRHIQVVPSFKNTSFIHFSY